MTQPNSYGQILRSSSIIGGAQGLNYLVSLVRVKIVAVLLGPTGVGLISLYQSTLGLLGAVSGMGVQSSAVREVARASSFDDPLAVAESARVLRRMCWATGLAGWALTAALSVPLSRAVFGTEERSVEIAVLGVTLLMGAVSGGQLALLQGLRRIGDLARAHVLGMLMNTVVAVGLYAWLGENGIVPVLVVSGAVTLGIAWRFARRVPIIPIDLDWHRTLMTSRRLFGLGFSFMWSAILILGLDMFTRVIITREHGIDAAGHYQAAWALSAMFAVFVLQAMGTDFYPRLTGVIQDRPSAIMLINEQTEIGILLALPGLLATLAFAPGFIKLFYSVEFSTAAALLPWFVMGVFGRVVSWPMGYVQQASGAGRWFIATESCFVLLQLMLVIWLVPDLGPIGAAYAFAVSYAVYAMGIRLIAGHLIGFQWSSTVRRLMFFSGLAVAVGVVSSVVLESWPANVVGAVVVLVGTMMCLRALANRLGESHMITRCYLRIPGVGALQPRSDPTLGGKKDSPKDRKR